MRRGLLLLAAAALCLGAGERADLSDIESWAIWLQDPDLGVLETADLDLVVIDYSSDGSEDGEFSHADIKRLRDAGKTVLAYFSIGEAEDYRFYWKKKWRVGRPGFIAEENPDWEGNYKVKYWSRGWWKRALRPYLDRNLDAGFDGVYLDVIDAYWWWHDEKGMSAQTTANRMAKLVERIASYARTRAGDGFIICPQNGVSLLDDASNKWRKRFLNCVDAVGVENLYYDVWSEDDQAFRLDMLEQFDAAGKRIFVIEYIGEQDWSDFFDAIADSGLDMLGYPAAPDAALDELITSE